MGFVLAKETSDLEDTKNRLTATNARLRQEMKGIEDTIVYKLSHTVGNILEDVELIDVLKASKMKYQEILKNVSN